MIPEGLYPVISQEFCRQFDSLGMLKAILDSGIGMVQLREKSMTKRAIFELARQYREITSTHNVIFIVNDHLDIALAVGADGVHLGQDDLPCTAARSLSPDLIIGVSTHNLSEARLAQAAGASYVNIGPIFKTQTKSLPIPPVGIPALKDVNTNINIPITTMGGIKEENLQHVLEAGARRIAMVTEITQAENPGAIARRLHQKIRTYFEQSS